MPVIIIHWRGEDEGREDQKTSQGGEGDEVGRVRKRLHDDESEGIGMGKMDQSGQESRDGEDS